MLKSSYKENVELYNIYKKDIIEIIDLINRQMVRGLGTFKLFFEENIIFKYKEHSEKIPQISVMSPIISIQMYIEIHELIYKLESLILPEELNESKDNFIQSINYFWGCPR